MVLDAEDVKALVAHCQRRAPHTATLYQNLLSKDPGGPVWRLVLDDTRAVTSVSDLAMLYNAALAAGRTAAWLPALGHLPAALVDALEPSLLEADQQLLQKLRS